MLPKTAKNFNLFREGDNWGASVSEVGLPKLTRKREDYRGAGMAGAVKIDLGYELGQLEITMKEYHPDLIKDWGECGVDGVQLRLLAGAQRDNSDCDTDAIDIVFRGRPAELDFGTLKPGELTDMKVPYDLNYYKYTVNGKTLIEIDTINMIQKIDGVDVYEKMRKAIGL